MENTLPVVEYSALVNSSLINGESKLAINEKGLVISALFGAAELPYSEINSIIQENYIVKVNTDGGDYTFSRLGSWCEPFYDTLCDMYNKAVLRSLFIKGTPLLTAGGNVTINETGVIQTTGTPIHVYENSVTSLPHDLTARRVPLCFAESVENGNFEYTIKLDTGESYSYAKLGYETEPFAEAVESRIRRLREQTLAAVKDIDPALTSAQASKIAELIPLGAAAPMIKLSQTAASFAKALETKLNATRASESYAAFKELCNPDDIWIGFRKNESYSSSIEQNQTDPPQNIDPADMNADGQTEGNADSESEDTPDEYLLWLIASSPDGNRAAVEFAEPDSATFIYRTNGNFSNFAKQLSRALEAIDFKREVIRLSDEELRKPEYSDYYMASKRTPALQTIRSNFVTRVIHLNAESWKKRLVEGWGEET